MKNILALLLITLIVSGCKKKDSASDPEPITIDNNGFDSNGFKWQKDAEVITRVRYITLVDTTYGSPSNFRVDGYALLKENDSLSVEWSIPIGLKASQKFSKVWNQALQKWIATYSLSIDAGESSGSGGTVRASFKNIATGQTFFKETKITFENRVERYDFFRVNFGMSKAEVKANETMRLGVSESINQGWYEPDPTWGIINAVTRYFRGEGYAFYRFENGKLVATGEVLWAPYDMTTLEKAQLDRLIYLAKSFGYYGTPQIEQGPYGDSYKLKSPMEWEYDGKRVKIGLIKIMLQPNKYLNTYGVEFGAI